MQERVLLTRHRARVAFRRRLSEETSVFLTLRRRLGEWRDLGFLPRKVDCKQLFGMPKTELLTREQMAQVLMLSPNRLSELTRAGHIDAATTKPLRYDRQHAAACYASYRWALEHDPDFLRRVEAQTSIVDNK
jgi:hypothetical protein